ncbi:hypothetical protein [Brachybacterium nesterenkovii]|nr:hypothetical protein [Brachybacterium nesterenkovii]
MYHERLALYFDTNDRTPLTDGHIDIHSGEPHSVETFQARIPVQIKARHETSKGFKGDLGFSLGVRHLKGMLKIGSVILFVVIYNRKARTSSVYWNPLTPAKLKRILENSVGQKTATIRVQKLPESESAVCATLQFINSVKDEVEALILEDGETLEDCMITISAPRPLDLSKPLLLDTTDSASPDFEIRVKTRSGAVARLEGVFEVLPEDYAEHDLTMTIESHRTSFTNPRGRKLDEHTSMITLGSGLTLQIQHDPVADLYSGTLTTADSGSMLDYRRALSFLTECFDAGFMKINGQQLSFEHAEDDYLAAMKSRLADLNRYAELFEALHVDESRLVARALNEKVRGELDTLHRAIVQQESIPAKEPQSGRLKSTMFNGWLALYCEYNESNDTWKVSSPYSQNWDKALYWHMDTRGEKAIVRQLSIYDLATAEDFLEVLNINLGHITESYRDKVLSQELLNQATGTLLRIISAADLATSDQSTLRDELLEAAQELSSWLLAQDPNSPFYRINAWQIKARTKGLSDDDKAEIYALGGKAHSGDTEWSAQVGYGCSVLRKDTDGMAFWRKRLTEEEQAECDTWPINNLISDEIAVYGPTVPVK